MPGNYMDEGTARSNASSSDQVHYLHNGTVRSKLIVLKPESTFTSQSERRNHNHINLTDGLNSLPRPGETRNKGLHYASSEVGSHARLSLLDSRFPSSNRLMPRQRCTRRLCLCLAVAVVSVVFGAAVGVYFGFRILEAETTKVKEFRGAFRVVSGDNYTEELMDVFSDAFLSRSRIYKARLDGIFSNSVLKKAYFGSEILAIDPGEMTSGEDVIVRFNIRMDPTKIDVDAGDVYLVLVNEILRGHSRQMTELTIDQDSIEVHERKSFTPPSRAPPLLHSPILKTNSDASRLITFLNEQDQPSPTTSTDHSRIDSVPMSGGGTNLDTDDAIFDAKSNILEAILSGGPVRLSDTVTTRDPGTPSEGHLAGSSRQRGTSFGRRPDMPYGSRREPSHLLQQASTTDGDTAARRVVMGHDQDRDAILISLSSQNRVSQTTSSPIRELSIKQVENDFEGDVVVTSARRPNGANSDTSSGRDPPTPSRHTISSGRDSLDSGRGHKSSGRDHKNSGRDSTNSGRDSIDIEINSDDTVIDSNNSGRDPNRGRDSNNSERDSANSDRDSSASKKGSTNRGRESANSERESTNDSQRYVTASGKNADDTSGRQSVGSSRESTVYTPFLLPATGGSSRSAPARPTAASSQTEPEIPAVNVVPHSSQQIGNDDDQEEVEAEEDSHFRSGPLPGTSAGQRGIQTKSSPMRQAMVNARNKGQSSVDRNKGWFPPPDEPPAPPPTRTKGQLASPPRILSITDLSRDRSALSDSYRSTTALDNVLSPPTAASDTGNREIQVSPLPAPPRSTSNSGQRRQPSGSNRGKASKPPVRQSQRKTSLKQQKVPTNGDPPRRTTVSRQTMTSHKQQQGTTLRIEPTITSKGLPKDDREVALTASKMTANNVSSIAAKLIPLLPLLTKTRQCVPPQLNMCANLTENFTSVPTLSSILDKEEIGPVFEFIRNVLESGCFEYAHFFVCQLLQPGCENGLPVLPCRSFCENFLDKCSHLLPDEIYHLLTCRILPEEKSSKCVATPECVHDLRARGQNYLVCDGIVDCYDMSDETRCGWCKPGQFVCGGRKCVNLTSRCDGKSDCPNGADERNCLALAGGAAEAAHAHPYTSEGFVFLNDKGAMGKICADTLLKSVAKDRREAVLKNVGESACDLLHYRKMTFVDTREDIDGVGPYFHILNPLSWRVTFLEAPCRSKQVVYAGCKDFACGKRPSHTPASTMRYLEPSKLSALVDHGDWPWHAALFNDEEHACDATLIDQQWLVTSAACFQGHGSGQWWAVIGGVRLDSESPFQQRRRLVARLPSPIKGSDVVLLKLDVAITLTDFVRPACLPRSVSMFRTGRQCITLGWDLPRSHLRQVSIILTETEECLWRWPVGKLHVFCTTEPAGLTNDCQGEDQAGGPLLCDDNGTWYLVGVVNWRIGCGLAKQPRLYDSVGVNTNWILSTIKNHQKELVFSQEIVEM